MQMEEIPLFTASSNNVKVSSHIPDDIVFSILSKLSLKPFKRFECVRKSWSLLFDNPYFMTMYHNHLLTKYCSYYEDVQLWNFCCDVYYSLSGERFDNIVQIDGPNSIELRDTFESDNNGFEILSPVSCKSTLDLQLHNFNGKKKVLMWNLIGNKSKIIPSHENGPLWDFSAHHFQIGYDHVKDDYKIIRCTHYSPKNVPSCGMSSGHFWEMYSQRSNSWKKIDVDMPHFRWSREQVYMDSVFHWWDKNETHTCLVSFDFCKESFIITPIPAVDDSFDPNMVRRHLMVLNGSIAFMLKDHKTSTFHISILGELGVKESWTKLFIFGLLPCLKYPIGAGKKGKIMFRKKDGKLAWFDLNTEMIDEIDVTTTETNDYHILFYNKSLPIRGIYTNFSSYFHPKDL